MTPSWMRAPGWRSRSTASQAIQAVRTTSAATLAWAASTSARRKPKVRFSSAGREAKRTASRASPSAATSVSMCPASETSASDPERSPPTASATMIPAVTRSESPRRRALWAVDAPWAPAAWSWS